MSQDIVKAMGDLYSNVSFGGRGGGGGGGGGGGKSYTRTNTPLACAIATGAFSAAASVPHPLTRGVGIAGLAATAYMCSGGGMPEEKKDWSSDR
jgi:hypothetical protein